MIWLPLAVLVVSLPAYIVVSERQILRLQRRVTQLSVGQANLTKQVAELEDEVIGLLKPKGQL